MSFVTQRLNEPSTKAALIFALGHTSALLAGAGLINWHAFAIVLINSFLVALTPEGTTQGDKL